MLPVNGWLTPELFAYADIIAAPLPTEFHAHYYENFRRYYTSEFEPAPIAEIQAVRASVETAAGTNDGGLSYGWDVILVLNNTYSAILVDTVYTPEFPDYAITEACNVGVVDEEVCAPESVLFDAEENPTSVYISDDANMTVALNDDDTSNVPNLISDSVCDSNSTGRQPDQECW